MERPVDIHARQVSLADTRGRLLAATSVELRAGELTLISGRPGSGRTALALVLTGRMRPHDGRVESDGPLSRAELRRRSAVVDAPEVSAPEPGALLRDIVAEGLSEAGRPDDRESITWWLRQRSLLPESEERADRLDPVVRTRVLTDLAAARPGVHALVLDCPDRHGGAPQGWFAVARDHAEQGWAVAVLCSPESVLMLGVPAARIGAHDGHCPAYRRSGFTAQQITTPLLSPTAEAAWRESR
ncbi:ATP-binding cassette domain-containing protein [Actinoalloteichus fjordicus]|uniref:ABC transporter n=1 Tax=Actinoalloteichus fjordicus TaxID=1612552 RepID=A0AAC9LC84_9PSEU|nr:ATP-binding cassette domain-containing protein [Actinoalloteichus fjordicus]APU14190.1 ABC transporter [Actinoalloteichus fjordicus]